LQSPPIPWEDYALYEISRATTDSWFYVPLLLDAFGVQRDLTFVRPPRWENYVQCCRVTFAQRNIVRDHYVSDSTTYLNRETQTTLMNYNYQAGQFIGFWIARLRNTRNATEPLPDANFET